MNLWDDKYAKRRRRILAAGTRHIEQFTKELNARHASDRKQCALMRVWRRMETLADAEEYLSTNYPWQK